MRFQLFMDNGKCCTLLWKPTLSSLRGGTMICHHITTTRGSRRRHQGWQVSSLVAPPGDCRFGSLQWRHNEAMVSQITNIWTVCSDFCSGTHKKKPKAPRHWPLWGESTGDKWIPLPKGQITRKMFHSMTSSCYGKSWCHQWSQL